MRASSLLISLTAVWLLAACAAPPVSVPVVRPPSDPLINHPFPTPQAAAIFALKVSYEASNAYEYAGEIMLDPRDGQYYITLPRTDYSGDSVAMPEGDYGRFIPVADYHDHPCLPLSHAVHWFSPQDIESAGEHIAFLADLCTGDVHEYEPGVDQPYNVDLPDDLDARLTAGRIIGQIDIFQLPITLEHFVTVD